MIGNPKASTCFNDVIPMVYSPAENFLVDIASMKYFLSAIENFLPPSGIPDAQAFPARSSRTMLA